MEDKEQPRTRNRQACHHMVKQQEISLIACIAQNGAIGFHNHLLYPIRQDMQRFKTLTTGHTVIMGRMTYLSLPNGPLPNRRNIIVSKTMRKEQSAEMTSANEAESKNRELSHASALQYEVCRSLEEAISRCRDQGEKEVFILGGAMLYRSALSLATRLYLVGCERKEGICLLWRIFYDGEVTSILRDCLYTETIWEGLERQPATMSAPK